jgi:hypothetical protein
MESFISHAAPAMFIKKCRPHCRARDDFMSWRKFLP